MNVSRLFTRHWRLKAISLLLSMFLWMLFHYSRAPKKEELKQRKVAVKRTAPARAKTVIP